MLIALAFICISEKHSGATRFNEITGSIKRSQLEREYAVNERT